MTTEIEYLLGHHGPCLTSTLIEVMVKEGASPAAARQRINRAKSSYNKLAGLRFNKNPRFIYLEDQYGTQAFWLGLESAFKSHGRAYWNAMVGLASKGGCCPLSIFPIVCGAPERRKGQLSPERIYERLSSINLLEMEQRADGLEPIVKFKPLRYPVLHQTMHQAILLAELVAIQAFKTWAKNIGFGSYGKFSTRGNESLPKVGGVAWDLTAPSYIRPLVSVSENVMKPGFVVADIYLFGVVEVEQVSLFIRKYNMASGPKNVAPIMAFMLADRFSTEAFDQAKSLGVMPVTISNLFGDDVAKALRDLISLLSDTGATASVNPSHLENVIGALTKIEGDAANIRGALFELVIGGLVKNVEGGFLSTGKKVVHHETGGKAEIDVLLDLPDQETSIVIECRAKLGPSKISYDQVSKWFNERVPLIYLILQQEGHYRDKKIRFEFWTNGVFHPAAVEFIEAQQSEFENYSVAWRDGADIKNYLRASTDAHIRGILNEHYFRNPLTMATR